MNAQPMKVNQLWLKPMFFAGLIFALAGVVAARANLIVNGGFETGDFSGWTYSGNPAFSYATSSPAPYDGSYSAQLAVMGGGASLSQSVATTPGQSYTVSFWLEVATGNPPNYFNVSWDGGYLLTATNLAGALWTQYTFDVVATLPTTVFSFGFRNDTSSFYIDDVRVEAKSNPPSVPDGGTTAGWLGFSFAAMVVWRQARAKIESLSRGRSLQG